MIINRLIVLAAVLLASIANPARSQTSIPEPAQVKADFLKLLDRPKVPLDPKSEVVKNASRSLVTEKASFATEARPDGSIERVPALLVKREATKPGTKLPVVIVLHGTGGNKEGSRPWLEALANRGFLAVAIDGRYHGERGQGMVGTKAYNEAITRAWRAKPGEPQAHPFYYDTCWDVWRTIDYLVSRPDVDPDRIGLIGISKGGIETWLAGAVDPRIKVAVPAISVQSFRWSLENERWQARANTIKQAHESAANDLGEPKVNARVCRELWAKILPGILDEFDGPSILRLYSDRSLLILNGEKDPNCPIEGAELAFGSARAAFHQAKADDHLKIMVAPGSGHTLTKEQHDAAIDWFVKWLKPSSPE